MASDLTLHSLPLIQFFLDINTVKWTFQILEQLFDKCPKLLYTKVSDKMASMYANNADSDQTAPEGAV